MAVKDHGHIDDSYFVVCYAMSYHYWSSAKVSAEAFDW